MSDEQVEEIRAIAAAGDLTQDAIAQQFGTTQQYISRIVTGKARGIRLCIICEKPLPRWRHICCSPECADVQHERWRKEHRNADSARAMRWQRAHPERYQEAHRKAAREYERRKRAKKREEQSA